MTANVKATAAALALVPRKLGELSTFTATNLGTGKVWTFQCKRLAKDCWYLEAALHTPRTRFGDKHQIAEDIQHALDNGNLPGQVGRP